MCSSDLGAYPGGPRPYAANNVLFLDELDVLDEATQDAAIAAVKDRGYDHIPLGPLVAAGYHHDYPDTNWIADPSPLLRLMHKVRRAGLRIVYTALPDVEPYYHTDDRNGGTWDWALIERDFTPIYTRPEFQALVEDVQHGWENICTNAEFVRAFTYLTRVFPTQRRWWHSWPGHSAPGLSSEPLTEAQMVANVKAAGCTGFFPQFEQRGFPDTHRDVNGRTPLESFCYDVRDFIRHLRDGYGGWPGGMDFRPREYAAYWIYNDGYPETCTPSDWGQAARDNGALGAMDGGPRA